MKETKQVVALGQDKKNNTHKALFSQLEPGSSAALVLDLFAFPQPELV